MTRFGIAWRLVALAGIAAVDAYLILAYWRYLYVPEPCEYVASACPVPFLFMFVTASLVVPAILWFAPRERWHDAYDGCESCSWRSG